MQKRIPDSQLDGFFETACDWFLVTDQDYIVTWCRKSANTGDPVLPENILGRHLGLFLPPSCSDEILSFLDPQYMLREVRRDTHFTDCTDESYYMSASGNWDEERFLGVNILIRKESAGMFTLPQPPRPQEENAAQLAYHLRQQELVACFAAEIASSRDLQTVLRMSLGWVGGFLEVNHCTIFRYDKESDQYSCLQEWHAPMAEPILEKTQNIPRQLLGEIHTRHLTRPHIIVNDTARQDIYAVPRDHGVTAFVDIPIPVEGEYWGSLIVDISNGSRKWSCSEVRLLKMTAGLISTALEKYGIQDKLVETLGRMQQIVERYPGLIWSVDKKDLRCTIFEGQGIAELLGDSKSPAGMTLEECGQLMPEEMRDGILRTFEEGPQQYAMEMGPGRTLTCSTTLLRSRFGAVTGMLGVALDVTEMRNMQRRLERAMREAEKANQAKSDFLARMSHEIRTPMNVIVGMTTLAQKAADPSRARYCLEQISTAGEQLLGLINDVLDMSAIESGKFAMTPAPFEFSRMMRNIITIMQVKITEKFIRFSFKREGLPHRMMICDERRLSQVITNLLSNAVKFTPKDGEVTMRARHISTGPDSGDLLIEVIDKGIGIAKENLGCLFESFEQADGSITRQYGGSGLGLAICKEILDLMGGEISVQSELGKGSTFYVRVPVIWGASLEEDSAKCGEGLPPVPCWADLSILAAEDIALNREIIAGMLEDTGARLEFAVTGVEAVRMFHQKNGEYDLILMDMQMPEMDGLSATREIRASEVPRAKTVPIIAMTANAFREDVEGCLAAGMNDHIAKPVNVEMMLEKLRKYLGG